MVEERMKDTGECKDDAEEYISQNCLDDLGEQYPIVVFGIEQYLED